MSESLRLPNFKQIRGILSVFDTGSLAAAAGQMGRGSSTLSQQITQTEALLRVRMFDRTTYGLVPSASGRTLESTIRSPLIQLCCAVIRASRGRILPSSADVSLGVRAAPAGSPIREFVEDFAIRTAHEMSLHVSSLSLSAAAPEDGLVLEPGSARTGAPVIRDRWILIGPPSADIELPELPAVWWSLAAAAAQSLGSDAGRTALPLERLDRLPRPLRSRLMMPSLSVPGWLRCNDEHKMLLRESVAPPCWVISHMVKPSEPIRALARELKTQLAKLVGRTALKKPRPIRFPDLERVQLECVAVAAQTGSLTRASALLGIAQPAATVRLRQAEQVVGRRLFQRTPSGLSPLPIGTALADSASGFLDVLEELCAQLSSSREPRGEIRIGAVSALDDGSLLAEALAHAAEIWTRRFTDRKLVLFEARADELRRMVLSSTIEFAVLDNDATQPGISMRPISIEPMHAIFSPKSIMPPGDTISLSQLAKLKLTLPSRRHGLRWSMERAARAAKVEFHPVAEIDSLAAIIRLVLEADWITILPSSAVRRFLRSGRLSAKPITGFTLERRLCIARRNGKSLDPSTLAFADLFQQCLKTNASRVGDNSHIA
jgi:LysR family nitrogen assimilation transcriptional regulator